MLKRGALLFVCALFLFASPAYAQGVKPSCGGVEPVIATEKEVAASGGVIKLGNWACPIQQSGITADVGDARIYLKSILCVPDGDNYGGAGPDATIDKLNPKFAECAAKFLKAASGQVPGQKALRGGGANGLCVKEGFRTTEKQNSYVRRGVFACKRGAACEHPSGIAIDVNTSSDAGYARLHQMAAQFNVNFYLGFKDKYHFVPKSGDCSTAGFKPNDASASASPTAQFATALRTALGAQPAQPAFPAQPASSQTIASAQSPLNSFSTMPTPLVSDTLVDTGTLATKSSIADRLEELAFGDRATTTKSATSVPLVINGNDRGGITSANNQGSNATTSGLGGAITQNTFTSQDLNQQLAPAIPQSTFQATLSILKTALLKMLEYLRPFSLRSTNQEVLE